MVSRTDAEFVELLARTRYSAVHLEMRDGYGVDEEAAEFTRWRSGWRPSPDPAAWWNDFHTWVRDATARGVSIRRARIVSEPVSDYIRYEYSGTFTNIAAGEQIRWLPRRQASDLALPGNDFWLFDDRLVQFNVFDGSGRWVHTDLSEDPAVARLCTTAFEAVWERAVPHERYHP